jgi:nitroreductase
MTDLADTPVHPSEVSLVEGLATTRAIRRYTDEPIPTETLRDILFAATRAPSGSNRQPFRFIVLDDPGSDIGRRARQLIQAGGRAIWGDKRAHDRYDAGSGDQANSPKARMARTMQQYVDNFDRVPVLVLPCLVRYREPRYSEGSNVYPACQNLLLAARAYGFGGVLTGFHTTVEDELRELLAIPDAAVIAATITLGRPAGHHGPVRRRPLAELVFGERWDAPPTWAVDPPGTGHTAAGPPVPPA